MKRALMCLLSIVTVISLATSAYAMGFSGEASSELNDMTDKIIFAVDELFGEHLTEDDIDYESAYKVYVDTNVFELSSNHTSEIEASLENGNYIYILPIQIGHDTIVVNIQKGLPLTEKAKAVLTEEEQQEVLENVDKWVISSVALCEGDSYVDYLEVISDRLGYIPDGTLLVGSLPIFRDVVALIPDNEGFVESIVPVTRTPYNLGTMDKSRSSTGVFDYSDVKAYANELPAPEPGEYGGATGRVEKSRNVSLNSLMVIGSIGILGVFFIVKGMKVRSDI